MSSLKLLRKSDYHVHTTYSFDGYQSVFEACEAALSLGLDEICFTEHLELGDPSPKTSAIPDFISLFNDIEKANYLFPALKIRKGVEIGYHSSYFEQMYQLLESLPFDFYLLSLHLIDNLDPYDQLYFSGKTQKEAYEKYLKLKLESVKTFPSYDAVAHLGYVAKFAPYPKASRPLTLDYNPDIIDEILLTLISKDKALEINASGIGKMGVPIPSPDIIKRYIELGGKWFTFSSDAHGVASIYKDVSEAKNIAIALGAKWELRFENRIPIPVPLF